MAARTLSATARTLSPSGPMTRNCTGKPTGGPKFSRSMRRRASGITFCGDEPFEPRLQPLARLGVLGHHHDEREALVRQDGVQGQEEARRAFADIGRVVLEVGVALDERFRLLGGGFGDADGRALRHADLDEELRPRRGREELLLHLREGGDAGAEGSERQRDDHPAEAHGPADGAAQRAIEARVIDVVAVHARRGAWRSWAAASTPR